MDTLIGMIQVQTDSSPPPSRNWIRRLTDQDQESILEMKPGQTFTCDKRTAYAAKSYGARFLIKLVVRKQIDGTYRVWRAVEQENNQAA